VGTRNSVVQPTEENRNIVVQPTEENRNIVVQPTEEDRNIVVQLTEENFTDLVMDSNKIVLVEFYAPCIQIPIYAHYHRVWAL
jgi:tRNA nucleotidyltransferase (CCA-adding enzyme)